MCAFDTMYCNHAHGARCTLWLNLQHWPACLTARKGILRQALPTPAAMVRVVAVDLKQPFLIIGWLAKTKLLPGCWILEIVLTLQDTGVLGKVRVSGGTVWTCALTAPGLSCRNHKKVWCWWCLLLIFGLPRDVMWCYKRDTMTCHHCWHLRLNLMINVLYNKSEMGWLAQNHPLKRVESHGSIGQADWEKQWDCRWRYVAAVRVRQGTLFIWDGAHFSPNLCAVITCPSKVYNYSDCFF